MLSGLFAAPLGTKLNWVRFFCPFLTLKTNNMRHSFSLSGELHIVGIVAILLYFMLLSVIAMMWIRIERQDETIRNLRIKISETECCKIADKEAVRIMCLHELFERIDYSDKEHSTIYQMP